MTAGCTGALRGGILYLTLDTQGSSVNVFTPKIALELEGELKEGLRRGARAVVLQSKKPGSFVNGVGLLLAASSHSQAEAMERAQTLRRCYQSLAQAPVPTIAAIEGNCYGCGLELALTCDYRLARDSYDTHFYMPELRDYSFIPLFGGTQRLPMLLGLAAAMDVLLGERVEGRRAARLGLVDRLAAGGMRELLPPFLRELREGGFPKRAQAKPGRAERAALPRIDALPGPERPLAQEGLRLARLPLQRGYRVEEGMRAELESFWRSLGRPESERAMSFFFVRQAAKAHAIGSASYRRPRRLAVGIENGTPALRKLGRILRRRNLPGISIGRKGSIVFSRGGKVRGALSCSLGSLLTEADCCALIPFPDEPVPPIELVPRAAEMPWQRGAPLFQFLEQAGFAPIVTRARRSFVSERMLRAFADAAGDADRRELLDFGFRLPAPLRSAKRPARKGAVERAVAALAAEAIRALDSGELLHVSQADLLAHLLFGFPVTRGSLLRHVAGGKSALAREARRVLGQL